MGTPTTGPSEPEGTGNLLGCASGGTNKPPTRWCKQSSTKDRGIQMHYGKQETFVLLLGPCRRLPMTSDDGGSKPRK
eukprot:1020339-Heterocapsa_arctica.AAC.1